MYREFYGFRQKPFNLVADPGFLYMSSKHRLALQGDLKNTFSFANRVDLGEVEPYGVSPCGSVLRRKIQVDIAKTLHSGGRDPGRCRAGHARGVETEPPR